jgi:hypothetical protein
VFGNTALKPLPDDAPETEFDTNFRAKLARLQRLRPVGGDDL